MGNLLGKKLSAEAEAALERSRVIHRAEQALLKGLDNFKRGRYLMSCSVSGAAFRWAPDESTGTKAKLGCLKAISFSRLEEWTQCCEAAAASLQAMNDAAYVNTPLEVILNSTLANAALNLKKHQEALRCGRRALKMVRNIDKSSDIYDISVTSSAADLKAGIYLTLTHAYFALCLFDEAGAIATEGTLCHDLPDDVKKVLFQLIARSAVGYERTQYNRSKGESAAGDKAHIEEIFCGWGDD